ncbi:MAG: hypothetical protein ACK4R9_00815 [Ignavibacterium sp.]
MKLSQKLLLVFIFSLTMAYLESAVVVYLRELYYPDGFTFPIKLIPEKIIFIELGRELATIVMLFSVAMISGKLLVERTAYFLFAFGVWDIFYYLWLKVFINWPESLLTDDLLFLIPVPWISPVLAPVLVSITFISFSVLALNKIQSGIHIKANKISLVMVTTGVVFILTSFMWNYEKRINSVSPVEFLWAVFLIGLLLISVGFLKTIITDKK